MTAYLCYFQYEIWQHCYLGKGKYLPIYLSQILKTTLNAACKSAYKTSLHNFENVWKDSLQYRAIK